MTKQQISPACMIDLRQLFWSTLNQTTYLAVGRCLRNEVIQRERLIPVHNGTTRDAFTPLKPERKTLEILLIYRLFSVLVEQTRLLD